MTDLEISETVKQSSTIRIVAKGMDLKEKGKTNFKFHIKELRTCTPPAEWKMGCKAIFY